MKLKVIVIIILLSLCFFFGFKKISNNRNQTKNTTIEELNFFKYLPKDNKLLFISNFESSNFINKLNKESNTENIRKIILIKNSILSYLGIDLGNNKLEEIYDNELAISTYENNKNNKDDILIIFKIKPEKNLNDLLNFPNYLDDSDEIIHIYRENKLNYLNYIYQTKDDYIIASSDKKLILDSIKLNNNLIETKPNYSREIMINFKNQNNILFSNKFKNNLFFPNNDEDIIGTTFTLRDKDLILKSYLINNKKNIDISSYNYLLKKSILLEDDYQFLSYGNSKKFIKNISIQINNFDKSLIEELNQKVDKNILILNSDKDWLVIFEKNNQNKQMIENIDKLKDFNKHNVEINDYTYSVYSKNILEAEEDAIKQITYDDIYSVESNDLFIISNKLINDVKLGLITTRFFDLKNNKDEHDFLYNKIDIKGSHSSKTEYLSYLDDLLFLSGSIDDYPKKEFIQIVKQSIPEKNPIFYTENTFKIYE